MKNKKLFAVIVMLLFLLLVSQGYAEKFTLSKESFEKVGKSTSNWMKEHIFLWYTMDTTGSLKSEYATERKVVDFLLFFIMFFSIALLGLRKVYEGGGNAIIALAFSIGFLLALSLVVFTPATLAIFFPFAKNVIFLLMLWIIFAILKKIFGDKHTVLIFIAALIITWLAFNYLGPGLGVSDTSLPRKDYSEDIDKLKSQIEAYESEASLTPREEQELEKLRNKLADVYVSQGLTEVEKRNYDEAEKNFREALMLNPSHNKAKYWIEDGMFNRMVKENVELLKVSKIILKSMIDEYKKSKDPDLCEKMIKILEETKKSIDTLEEEVSKKMKDVGRERERLGIIECKRNSDCKDSKEGFVCHENICKPCTESPDLCGAGRQCNAQTGKCEPKPRERTSTGGGGESGGWKPNILGWKPFG